jgi:hypothetical protein
MNAMDRRQIRVAAMCGAGVWLTLAADAAQALLLEVGAARQVAGRMKNDVTPAQVVVRPAVPRRRRWVYWWHRRRRVCGWRWV